MLPQYIALFVRFVKKRIKATSKQGRRLRFGMLTVLTNKSGRRSLVEDNFWWRMTFGGRRSWVEDNLGWKTTFGGRHPSVDPCMLSCLFCGNFFYKRFDVSQWVFFLSKILMIVISEYHNGRCDFKTVSITNFPKEDVDNMN